jgi:MICOS complex subunit MIC12
MLRQQRQLLTNVVEPQPPAPEPVTREVPVGLVEMAKDRWNREIQNAVKGVYEKDWRRWREDMEDRVEAVVDKIKENGSK